MADKPTAGGAGSSASNRVRLSRRNTLLEKRRMRNNRRRRKRENKSVLAEELAEVVKRERRLREKSELRALHFKNMSRSYWERWNWELQKRKEAMAAEMMTHRSRGNGQYASSAISACSALHEIDPSNIVNPEGVTDPMDLWIGRGSFGVVKLQVYRGIEVAVKELLPKTMLADVQHEARVIMKLCHPHLPYLFGVCTTQPYKVVLQFHGIGGSSVTLAKAITERTACVTSGATCLLICIQMMEALRYMHNDAGVLHNDLKCNNVLLTQPALQSDIHIIICDFGKATYARDHTTLRLSGIEQAEYTRKYPHIAPEVVEGKHPFSCSSDIFSAGGILFKLGDNDLFSSLTSQQQSAIAELAEMCRLAHYYKRPKATKALSYLQNLYM